jgi:hypothetical protein
MVPLVLGGNQFRIGGSPDELDCATLDYRELLTKSS